jgi:ABC-type nitrate/sulfonate/bicarbonate transport system substrate-binding protein
MSSCKKEREEIMQTRCAAIPLYRVVFYLLLGSLAYLGTQLVQAAPARAADAPAVVRPDLFPGVQIFPIQVMQKKGFASKYNLEVKSVMLAGPQAVYQRMQRDDFQMGFGAWPKIAQLRHAGAKVVMVYSMLGYTNEILVKTDSPIKDVTDLKGKRVAVFGGPGAGTTAMFMLEMKNYYDFDPLKQAHIFYGALGLVAAELERGQVDAALLLEPFSDKLLATGKFRSVGNLGKIWEKHNNASPMLLALVMGEKWADANPIVAKRFVAAYSESLLYLKTHKEIWKELAAGINIKDPAAVELLRKNASAALINKWNDAYVQSQLQFASQLTSLFEHGGGSTADLSSVFTTRFVPSANAKNGK